MKSRLHLLFFLGTLALAQPPNPIHVTLSPARNGVKAVIQNDSNVNLTAIAFTSPTAPAPYFFDSAVKRWFEVQPGHQTNIGLGSETTGVEFKAAILADGRTFGDPTLIQAILAKRRATSQALDRILQHLPTTAAPGPLIPLFRSYRDQQTEGLPDNDPIKIAIVNANMVMERQMKDLTGDTPDAIIATVTTLLRDWRTDLNQSLPNFASAP